MTRVDSLHCIITILIIGVARILSGVHFFLAKLTTFFTRRFQKTVHFCYMLTEQFLCNL